MTTTINLFEWGLFLGIGALGVAASMAIGIYAYRRLVTRGLPTPVAAATAILVVMVSATGLWAILGPYLLVRRRGAQPPVTS